MFRPLFLILVLLAAYNAAGRVQYNRSFAERALDGIDAPVLQAFTPVGKATNNAPAPFSGSRNEYEDPTSKRRLSPDRMKRPDYVVDRMMEYKKWRKAQIAPGLMIGGGSVLVCSATAITAGVLRDERSTARGDLSGFFLAFTGVILAGAGLGMLITGAVLHHKYGKYRHSRYTTPY